MATAYDNWKTSRGLAAELEEARNEAIAERAAELKAERLQDDDRVQDALSDMLGDDYDGFFDRNLRAFLRAFDGAETSTGREAAGQALFDAMRPGVEALIARDAESDAWAEIHQQERASADMRSEMRAEAQILKGNADLAVAA